MMNIGLPAVILGISTVSAGTLLAFGNVLALAAMPPYLLAALAVLAGL